MKPVAHGVWRRLQRLTSASGHFCVLAIDHRDALRVELAPKGGDLASVPADSLTTFKADLMMAMGERPSAVMLEPEYSLPHLTDRGLVPRTVGVFCALEAQGYLADPMGGNRLLPDWSARHVLSAGADGAKLLVLYRHDRPELTAIQDRLVAESVEACAGVGLPLLVEPVPFDVADEADRRTVILESARRLAKLDPTILKVPYPGPDACAELTEACGRRPWTLLSWGVPYDEFAAQLTDACAAGCSGFTVGRALWREALDPATRAEVLEQVVGPRFDELTGIAATGRPLHTVLDPPSTADWAWTAT